MADEEKRPEEEVASTAVEHEARPANGADHEDIADHKDIAGHKEIANHGDGHGHADHAHGQHAHGGHGGEHFAHTAPAPMLIGVFVALILLTILTVGVTAVDLGANGNLVIAMVIATVKAILVMGYFMHMFWDSRFNVLAFTSSFLFLILFLAMALADRGEYQDSIDRFEADKKAIELGK